MLQIQPIYRHREKFAEIARCEHLSYEVLELSMPLLSDAEPSEMAQWYHDSGKITGFHGVFMDVNPASGNEEISRLSQKQMDDSCRLAKSLGSSSIVFHCSCFPFLRGPYLTGWAEKCALLYDQLVEKWDLDLYIENSFDVSPDPLKTLMDKVRSHRVGVCLDIGHANYSRNDIADWFNMLGDHIGYLHLSDNQGLYDDHLPLGQGTVNWHECDALVKSLGKALPMTLEVGGPEGIEQSLAYLKSNHLFGY